MADRDAQFRDFALGQVPALRRLAYALTGDWPRGDDLVREALERAYVRWARMRAADEPAAYSRTILMRVALPARRRPWRRSKVRQYAIALDSRGGEGTVGDPPDTAAQEDRVDDAQGRPDLAEALAGLPGPQRAILVLRFVEDRPVHEVAAIVGVGQRPVRRQAHDAVRRLLAPSADPDQAPRMPEHDESLDEEAGEVAELILRAAERTTPPGPLDVTPVVRGGQRRRAAARRRAAGAVCVAATVAGIGVLLPQLSTSSATRAAPPSRSATPTPPPSDPSTGPSVAPQLTARQRLDRALRDPQSFIDNFQVSDSLHASTVLGRCDRSSGACDRVLLVTTDGWRHVMAVLLPDPPGPIWTRLLPDGSVAFAPAGAGNDGLGLLRPDGSVSSLARTARAVSAGPAGWLTAGPDLHSGGAARLWLIDPRRHTLSPLRKNPPGDGQMLVEPTVMTDGSVAVAMLQRTATRTTIRVARTADGGRTWTTTPVTARSRAVMVGGSFAAGHDGQMAVGFFADVAGTSPLVELWQSRDSGRHWALATAKHQPPYVTSMGYLGDGSLLLTDDMGRLWRQTADRRDFARVAEAPLGNLVGTTRQGGVVLRIGTNGFAVSMDGAHWTATALPTDPAAYTLVGSAVTAATPAR